MKKLLHKIVIKFLLKDYEITERQLPNNDVRAAMVEFAKNEVLQKMINITVANLIRRHIYIKNMEEKNWYSGQVIALRNLQEKSKLALQESKKKEENPEEV